MIKKITGLLLIPLLIASGLYVFAPRAHAYSSNHLLDGVIFDNTGTMNASQIDTWLNGFPSSCISPNSGFTAADPTGYTPFYPYVDGKYTYGAPVTAGQVIYDVAVGEHINPQVLLTKLQNEEQLVDGSQGCDNWRYTSAVGYACTDGGTNTHNYTYTGADPYASGAASSYSLNDSTDLVTPLYYRNGVPVNSISGSCVNANVKAGFSEQVVHAAWLLSFSRHKSEGQTSWAAVNGNWNHCEDNNTCAASFNIPSNWACYSGFMTQGNFKRCPTDSSAVPYDGYATIDGQSIHIDNGPTAALYVYTPHIQSFDTIFSNWFGSPVLSGLPGCDEATNTTRSCVWELKNPANGEQYLTSSIQVRDVLYSGDGYQYIGKSFFGNVIPSQGNIPVYRASIDGGGSFLTTNITEYNNLLAAGYNADGIDFYADPSWSNTGYQVYRLYNPATGDHRWTTSLQDLASFVQKGWTNEGIAFTSISAVRQEVAPPQGKLLVYRFYIPQTYSHFWTTDVYERDNMINAGYKYEGVAWYSSSNTADKPVYRLFAPSIGQHLYTADANEKDQLVASGNWQYEGVSQYVSQTPNSSPVYRLYAPSLKVHQLTTDPNERSVLINSGNWNDEGIAWYQP